MLQETNAATRINMKVVSRFIIVWLGTAPNAGYNKKSVELIVYLQEALVSRVQINNTPHPYGDCAECTVHQTR